MTNMVDATEGKEGFHFSGNAGIIQQTQEV